MDSGPITIVCAWCGVLVQAGNETVSHGICASCAMEFLESLPPEFGHLPGEPGKALPHPGVPRRPVDPLRPCTS
ncbi:MAG: hypothetical protein LC118_05150 [Dehalococcoidia bacterium]|nr:hypothetical protein [Dehalococcoidia bacterium]